MIAQRLKKFEDLLLSLDYLSKSEKALFRALFIVSSESRKESLENFLKNQQIEFHALKKNYETKLSSATEKFLNSISLPA